jgi:protein TonB
MARRKTKKRSVVYMVSVGVHLAVGAALAFIPQEKLQEVVAIALNEVHETKKPEPPKPPEHRDEPRARAPGHNARPAPVARAAAVADDPSPTAPAFTDIGLALDSTSSDGLAINIEKPKPVEAPVAPPPPKPKILVPKPIAATENEEVVKPRPLSVVRATYTDEARLARVQGRVVMELAINDRGDVTDARVVSGLGYGLDDAALSAARRLRFSPALRGSRPVATSYVIAMRFSLGT